MTGFGPLFGKELREQWRTRRLLVVGVAFLAFGIASPLLARYTQELVRALAGEKFEMAPGDTCFFPAEAKHLFVATTPRAKVMVIYAPPYGENPKNVIR